MAKPITLITGEPFLVDQEVRKWTSAFASKFGPESIFVFAEHPLPTKQIISTITGGGLFASKSCVVIHGLPLSSDDRKSEKEKAELDEFIGWFVDNYSSLSSDTIIMFVSANPDKRGKLFKLFDSAGADSNLGAINYPADQSSGLRLVTQQLGERCSSAQCQTITDLIATNDMYRIWHETNKIRDYIQYHITIIPTVNPVESVEVLKSIITPHIDQDSFAVIDSILYKSSVETFTLIDRLQQVDDNPYGFLGLLYRGLRGVIMTVDAMKHGVTANAQLMSLTKLPPFTVGRITKNYDSLVPRMAGLKVLFSELITLEHQIKTGLTPVEMFRPSVKTTITRLR